MKQSAYDEIKPFYDDLIELFEKHGLKIAKNSVSIGFSPLKMDGFGSHRDITFHMEQICLDDETASKHGSEFGFLMEL